MESSVFQTKTVCCGFFFFFIESGFIVMATFNLNRSIHELRASTESQPLHHHHFRPKQQYLIFVNHVFFLNRQIYLNEVAILFALALARVIL